MRSIACVLIALSVAACVSAPPQDPEAEVRAWAQARHGEKLRGPVRIFRGDFTGDGAPDAFAWVMYNDGGLRNFPDAALFRNRGGRLVFWRMDETAIGDEPRDVLIVPGRITLTTTVPQDGDPGCCPTGARSWVIDTR